MSLCIRWLTDGEWSDYTAATNPAQSIVKGPPRTHPREQALLGSQRPGVSIEKVYVIYTLEMSGFFRTFGEAGWSTRECAIVVSSDLVEDA